MQALHTGNRVFLPVKPALPSLQPTVGGKIQQKRGKLLQQASSSGAVSSAASTDASTVRWTEVNGSGNLEGALSQWRMQSCPSWEENSSFHTVSINLIFVLYE